ncbi:elongator complex protein 3, putative [Plasmodium chabaudi chabaudi]|uniref:tRNA carboxymethyluridine synthase n=1 Tax=Plasmodium chabaudi chabaudi TaxID=31271 RepID=A0A4V0KDB4_PLACU|nr:elongator complex protein 3, putative [Plasmodium chabaudi chabaudi]VTZ71122.1 elongator complex protein 3, putative [Plasmodium chabaudi chabaudi]|eukprot:XP_732420.2 histone acetyltransferase, putative [Plasmodium chabaudi chabaudi]
MDGGNDKLYDDHDVDNLKNENEMDEEELNKNSSYIDDILNESSDGEDIKDGKKEGKVDNENFFYINDVLKLNYPVEYEDNKIYPKVYCYEPQNFEKFKKKLKNKNELRHYECYSSTMNEFFYKYNENYYDGILKNESFKKFAEELWANRSNIKNETEYNELCIQLRKKYKVSPSKHQIGVALQHYYLKSLKNNNGENNDDNDIINYNKNSDNVDDNNQNGSEKGSNTSDVSNTNNVDADDATVEDNMNNETMKKKQKKVRIVENNENDKEHTTEDDDNEFVINKKGKDVKFTFENVNKMIIAKEMTNYKDLDKESVNFLQINKRKGVRSNSGVLVVTIITHPHKFSCKYDCHYCPNEPNQPRSYLSTEPAILRANQNNFDVICQFFNRTTTLVNNGHVADKIEVLVLGGTWSCYDVEYQHEFIRDIYYAANIYPILKNRRKKLSLKEEQELNEKSNCRIIGLTLETRPDQINKDELLRLRYYGCTRVQLGIQHVDDYILKKVNRQCTLKDCIRAIYLLKENGFKVDIHLMPDLPYSSVQKDIEMFKYVLMSTDLQADQWKIYPCEITPFTKIEKWYNNNEFKPYFETDKNLLISVILLVKKSIHPWIRLNRVIRDIPNPSIIAGNNITNMRQLIATEMNIRNIYCQCIRCKEIKNQELEKKSDSIFLKIYKYPTLGGDEFFITFQGKKLIKHHGKSKKAKKKQQKEEKRKRNEQEKQKRNNLAESLAQKENIENIDNDDTCETDDFIGNLYNQPNDEEINRTENSRNVLKNIPKSTPKNVPKNNYSNKYEREEKNNEEEYDNAHSLLGFLRLRLRKENDYCKERPFKCLENAALIRELHVYGSLLKHDDFKDELNFIQHKGLGKCLVLVAEIIAYSYKYKKMAIIAGVGTREYYKKLGYVKEETYMTKMLNTKDMYKNYLLNINKIKENIVIYNYDLKHCLYLMHKEIPEISKYKRSEIQNLNEYINENIIQLGINDYMAYKNESTISTINVKKVLCINQYNIISMFVNTFNKIYKNIYFSKHRFLFNTYTVMFFSTTFFISMRLLKNRHHSNM